MEGVGVKPLAGGCENRLLACSSACAKANTDGKRSCGFFCSAIITTRSTEVGKSGAKRRNDGGMAVACLIAISVIVP